MATEILGIIQTDHLLRSGIVASIEELRRQAWLLPWVFRSLQEDELTKKTHGQAVIDLATRWFLDTEIPVFLNVRLQDAKAPCVTITLQGGQEAEATLGDVHYQPAEVLDLDRVTIAEFNPVSYDPATGSVVVPSSVEAVLVQGLSLFDARGLEHPIVEVDGDTLKIQPGVVGDFSKVAVRTPAAGHVASVESVVEQETYLLGCHVQGEVDTLMYLVSVLKFVLLMFKQKYLEARGFERTRISATDLKYNPDFGQGQNVYSRYVSITGFVRHVWPKEIRQRPLGALVQLRAIGAGRLARTEEDLRTLSLLGDQDSTAEIFGGPGPDPFENPPGTPGLAVRYGSALAYGDYDETFAQSLGALRADGLPLYLKFSPAQGEYGFVAVPRAFGEPSGFRDPQTGAPVSFSRVQADLQVLDERLEAEIEYSLWRTDRPRPPAVVQVLEPR